MTNHSITANSFWLWGGLVGLMIPTALFALFQVLGCFRVAFGEHLLTTALIIAISVLELPTVIIGRALHLPIENGGAAFVIFDLSPFGHMLAIVFWVFVGLLIGYTIDRILSVK